MGSLGAMQQGSSDRYFQDNEANADKLVPEGIEGSAELPRGLNNSVGMQVLPGWTRTPLPGLAAGFCFWQTRFLWINQRVLSMTYSDQSTAFRRSARRVSPRSH